ncbi:MAG TPA: NADH-quinone oxidoreductase subunit A [Phycisphaerae bacterium]|jgi:NADH:ubiquinone oxidoreductase subunit 3 (subunit A)|nr:NADH-quinone oxidoreductase subunit A [Phycisphaerae bacterium]HOB75406.1 NADH-quinone oxidoreductase subunit A [Phycisphaerae bacterium]HOJ55661.1 NADH-quinone oxidoreductase subunit A [Phycisphaerae bacterium]HOL27672.1 NADH-quinone oxidoreductase subunit A [Phycisphaerae bacterium]HPP21974.1 NADH-quinone oxidoreductase subunit A [Phycisphaerae bacterium]
MQEVVLAQAVSLAPRSYAPILVLILLVMALVAGILILTHVLGPKRHGRVKDDTYEAGMPPVGDARRRFKVQFYIVAMLFLLFDVEVVFMWPWAPLFHHTSVTGQALPGGFDKTFLLVEMAVFLAILLVGYVYAWKKGVFRWN